MALRSPVTIAEHAARAGWRGAELAVAVAVALATSQGFDERPGGLWGLPDTPGGDAAGNATAAFKRWESGGGWRQWAAWRDKRYLLYMPIATAATAAATVKEIVAGTVARPAQSVADAAAALPAAGMLDAAKNALSLAYKAGAWIGNRDSWVRVAEVVVGAALLIGALVVVARPATEAVAGAAATTVLRKVVKK